MITVRAILYLHISVHADEFTALVAVSFCHEIARVLQPPFIRGALVSRRYHEGGRSTLWCMADGTFWGEVVLASQTRRIVTGLVLRGVDQGATGVGTIRVFVVDGVVRKAQVVGSTACVGVVGAPNVTWCTQN